jgi:transposase-like protein
LGIEQILGNRQRVSVCFGNIARLDIIQKDFPSAAQYLEKSLKIQIDIHDRYGESMTYFRLAHLALSEERHADCIGFLSKGIKLSYEVGHKILIPLFLTIYGYEALALGKIEAAVFVLTAGSLLFDEVTEKTIIIKHDDLLHLLNIAKSRLSAIDFQRACERALIASYGEIVEKASSITPEMDQDKAIPFEDLRQNELFYNSPNSTTPTCPVCGSDRYIRNGKDANGKQKFRCLECGKSTRETPLPHTPKYDERFKDIVISTYRAGLSQRETCRKFDINRQTLNGWLKNTDNKKQ